MFDVLFEFDRRHNFKTKDDINKYVTNYLGRPSEYQTRIEAFLSERIATIFYYQYFNNSRIKVYNWVNGSQIVPKNSSDFYNFWKKEKKIPISKIIILGIILIIIFAVKYFRNFKIKRRKYEKIINNNEKRGGGKIRKK